MEVSPPRRAWKPTIEIDHCISLPPLISCKSQHHSEGMRSTQNSSFSRAPSSDSHSCASGYSECDYEAKRSIYHTPYSFSTQIAAHARVIVDTYDVIMNKLNILSHSFDEEAAAELWQSMLMNLCLSSSAYSSCKLFIS